MKILTPKHFEKLDALHLQEYLDQCVRNLEEIDFSNPFPQNKEDYLKFVTHIYDVAKAYGLANEKYAFALMLAWHVRGQNFIREKRVVELLPNQNIDAYTKHQFLMKIAIETMEAYEAQKGEENDG
jgi:hypothetical protein